MKKSWMVIYLLTWEMAFGAKIKEVKVMKIDDNVRVTVLTDALEYKDFVLQDSDRVVIDFLNSYSYLPSPMPSEYSPLIRIRASQYTLRPIPITRVVLDLEYATSYSISRISEGVQIDLGKIEKPIKPVVTEAESILTAVQSTKRNSAKKETDVVKVTALKKEMDTVKVVAPKKEVDTVKVATLPLLEPFFYNSRGKRDPFIPYVGIQSKDTLLDVSTTTIVGIMWSPEEKYALAEDASGKVFILIEGDAVSNGKVLAIEKKEVTFLVHVFGGTKKVTLKITPKKEKE